MAEYLTLKDVSSWEETTASPADLPKRRDEEFLSFDDVALWDVEDQQPEPERGLLGDVVSHTARGLVSLAEHGAQAVKTVTDEAIGGDIARYLYELPETTPILRPDVSEIEGEGAIKRGGMGALESAPMTGAVFGGAYAGAKLGALTGTPAGVAVGSFLGAGAAMLSLFGFGSYGRRKDEVIEELTATRPELSSTQIEEMSHANAMTHAKAEVFGESIGDAAAYIIFSRVPGGKIAYKGGKVFLKTLAAPNAIKAIGLGVAKDMPFEVGSEMGTAYFQQRADEKIGIEKGTALQNMGESIIPAMFLTGGMGIGIGGYSAYQRKTAYNSINSKDPKKRADALRVVANNIAQSTGEKKIAEKWFNAASQYMKDGQDIPLDVGFSEFIAEEESHSKGKKFQDMPESTPELSQQNTLTNIKAALESGEITTDDVTNFALSPEAQKEGIVDDLNALIVETKAKEVDEIAKPPDIAPSAKDVLTEGEDVTARDLLKSPEERQAEIDRQMELEADKEAFGTPSRTELDVMGDEVTMPTPTKPTAEVAREPVGVEKKAVMPIHELTLDEFEKAGHSPWEITQSQWVNMQRTHRKSLGQAEESGTRAAPFGDIEQFHRQEVEQARKEGLPVPENVIAEYEKAVAGEKVEKAEVKEPWKADTKLESREYQEKYPEKTVHMNWDLANSPRHDFEGAGDILREFQKKNQDPHYISEKLGRVKRFVEGHLNNTLHFDDSLDAAIKHAPKKLNRLISQYESQPVSTESQKTAKSLILNIMKGSFKEAENNLNTIENNIGKWTEQALKPQPPKPKAKDNIDNLIESFEATGHVATRYSRKRQISVDGRIMNEKEAIAKMRRVVEALPPKPKKEVAPEAVTEETEGEGIPKPVSIPKELEPLAVEARKYKNADEFAAEIKRVTQKYNSAVLHSSEAQRGFFVKKTGLNKTETELHQAYLKSIEAIGKYTGTGSFVDFYNKVIEAKAIPEAKPEVGKEKVEVTPEEPKPFNIIQATKKILPADSDVHLDGEQLSIYPSAVVDSKAINTKISKILTDRQLHASIKSIKIFNPEISEVKEKIETKTTPEGKEITQEVWEDLTLDEFEKIPLKERGKYPQLPKSVREERLETERWAEEQDRKKQETKAKRAEKKAKASIEAETGTVWIKNVQKPILSARKIARGKNKGKYEVVLTKGRDAEGNIKPGLKKIVAEDAIIKMPLEKPTGVEAPKGKVFATKEAEIIFQAETKAFIGDKGNEDKGVDASDSLSLLTEDEFSNITGVSKKDFKRKGGSIYFIPAGESIANSINELSGEIVLSDALKDNRQGLRKTLIHELTHWGQMERGQAPKAYYASPEESIRDFMEYLSDPAEVEARFNAEGCSKEEYDEFMEKLNWAKSEDAGKLKMPEIGEVIVEVEKRRYMPLPYIQKEIELAKNRKEPDYYRYTTQGQLRKDILELENILGKNVGKKELVKKEDIEKQLAVVYDREPISDTDVSNLNSLYTEIKHKWGRRRLGVADRQLVNNEIEYREVPVMRMEVMGKRDPKTGKRGNVNPIIIASYLKEKTGIKADAIASNEIDIELNKANLGKISKLKKAFDSIKRLPQYATKATKPQDTITRADLKSIFAKMKNISTGVDKDGNFFFRPFGKPVVTIYEVREILGYKPLSVTQRPDVKSIITEKSRDAGPISAKKFSDIFRADSFLDHLNDLIQIPLDSAVRGKPSDLVLRKVTSSQRLRKSVSRDIQFLSNILSSKPFREKGFSGLDVKTQRLMLSRMRSMVKNFKVTDSIVKSIPVDMVDDFSWEKFSFEKSLQNPSVFIDILSVLSEGRVFDFGDLTAPIIKVLALDVTKNLAGLTNSELIGVLSDSDATISTSSIYHKIKDATLYDKSQEEFEGYIDTSKGRIPVGSFLGNTIELKTGGEGHTADTSIIFHEFFHWLSENGIVSANDIISLNRVIAKSENISESDVTEEHRADFVGDHLAESHSNPRIKRILKKIADFMNAIYEFVTKTRTVRGVLSDIETGRLLDKEITGEKAGALSPAYSMAGVSAIGAPTGQLVKAQEMLSHIATSKPTPLETILNRIFAGSKFSFNIPKSHPTMKEGDSGIDIKAKPLGGRAIIGDASTFEISGDSATINVKSFGDLSKVQAFVKHGFDFMDIESKRVVIANMISASRELKVRKAIVESIPVGMMNNLRRQKLSPDMLLHDQSMLQSLFAINLKSSIPIGMDIARSIIVSETPSIAKISLVDFRRYSVKDSPATVAKDFQHDIPSHKVSVTIPASEEGVKSKVIAGKTMPYESQGIPEDQWIITDGKGTSFSILETKQFATKPTKDYRDMLKRYQVKHTTPLVDELIKKTQADFDPVSATPEETRAFFKDVRLMPKRFRSEVLSIRDMKWYHKAFETPYVLAKKFISMEKALRTEIRRHESRTKKVFGYYHGDLADLQKHMQKNPEDLKAFENLLWEWEGQRFSEKEVPTDWYSVVEDVKDDDYGGIRINPEHYTEVRKYLKKQGVKDVIADGFISVRKLLDNVLIEADSTMRSNNIDQSDLKEFRSYIGKAHNYFSHVREGNSYIKIKNKSTGKTIYREHFWEFKERMLSERKRAKTRTETWLNDQIESGKLSGEKSDYIISPARRVTKLPDEVFFQIPVEALSQISTEAGRGLAASRVRYEALRLMKKEGLSEKEAHEKADKTLTADIERHLARAMADVLKTRGWGQHAIQRQNIPGFKKADVFETLSGYLTGYAGFATKLQAAKEHSKTLRDMDAKKTPAAYKYISDYIRDMLANADKTDQMVDRLRAMFFVKYLGGVVKSGMVNLTQNIVMAGPILSQYTKGSHLKLARAMKDVRKGIIGKNAWMGKETSYTTLPENEQKALIEGIETGVAQDLYLRELKGDIPGKGWGRYAKKVIDKAGIFMMVAEKFNRASTLLAAYRIAFNEGTLYDGKQTKKNHDLSVRFAKKAVYDSHFLYGKPNLPAGFRGGDFRKVARAAYTFRSFTHNYLDIMVDLMANQGTQGFKVAGRSLMNLLVVGGLTSIPFFKALSEIIQWAQDDEDEDMLTEIRSKMPNKFMQDMVVYGLSGAVGGFDLSGSLSIEIPTKMKEIIGVPYSMYEDSMRTVASVKAGNMYRAVSETPFTPIAMRNAMRGIELYTKGQRTRGGKAINVPGKREPRKITGVEAVKKAALGLQPVEVSSGYKAYRAATKMKRAIADKKRDWADKIANATIDRDFKKVREIKAEIREWNLKARRERKLWRVVDIDKMIENRLQGKGLKGFPVKMRSEAQKRYNVWQ